MWDQLNKFMFINVVYVLRVNENKEIIFIQYNKKIK